MDCPSSRIRHLWSRILSHKRYCINISHGLLSRRKWNCQYQIRFHAFIFQADWHKPLIQLDPRRRNDRRCIRPQRHFSHNHVRVYSVDYRFGDSKYLYICGDDISGDGDHAGRITFRWKKSASTHGVEVQTVRDATTHGSKFLVRGHDLIFMPAHHCFYTSQICILTSDKWITWRFSWIRAFDKLLPSKHGCRPIQLLRLMESHS